MTDLTVVVWKWNGWRKGVYQPSHVMAMKRMLEENLHVPHEFVCVTDDPEGLACRTMPLWNYPDVHTGAGRPNCYRRLRVFSEEARTMFGPRLLSIDLDCVIMGDITPLITGDDLKLVQGKACPYNGSMFLHNTGSRLQLWNDFNKNSPDVVRLHERKSQIRHYGSDQAWISYKCPGEPTWGERDGVHHYTLLLDKKVPPTARIIFCAGSNKPWGPGMRVSCPEMYETYCRYLPAEVR